MCSHIAGSIGQQLNIAQAFETRPLAMITAPVLRVAHIRPLLDVIMAAGLDPARVLTRAGLAADVLEVPRAEAIIGMADYFRICEQMALQGKDESCRVSLRPLMVGTSEFVQARLVACRTLGAVMDAIASSWNIIHGSRYNIVRRRAGRISYIVDDASFPYVLGHDDAFVILSIECLLVCVHMLMQSFAADGKLPLAAIRTRAQAPRPGSTHLAFWNVPIRYNSPVFALDYDANLDRVTIDDAPPFAGRTLYGGVAAMFDQMTLREPTLRTAPTIRDRVAREIIGGCHDQDTIAATIGLSVASLRRRLAEAGLTFRELRADVLGDIARQQLRDGNSIAATAEMLGFSDGRSFARAFRQWTGTTPAAYRLTTQA